MIIIKFDSNENFNRHMTLKWQKKDSNPLSYGTPNF
jgi:hypothetical protein